MQLSIDFAPRVLQFDGATFDQNRDSSRLTAQYTRVLDLMRDGQWRTLEQIAAATGDPAPSVSARLRDMRKPRFGAHVVNRRYVRRGLFEYQVVV